MIFRSYVLFLTVLMLILPQYASSQDEKTTIKSAEEPVTVSSDSMKIAQKTGWMDYIGKVVLKRGDTILSADKMSYNMQEKTALAEGNVLLVRSGFSIACDKITYNVKEDSGVAEFVSTYSQSWYGWGKEITRVSKDEYRIKEGYVTTDPYPKPGWRIEAKEIRLFPGDRVEARNIKMYVKNTPIIFLPYYRASLKDGHSPLSVELGYNNDWGAYALVAYDLLLQDGLHTIFRLDGRTERGWAEGIDLKGSTTKGGYYESKFYTAQDKKRDITNPDGTETTIEDDRYRIDLKSYNPLTNDWDIRYELHKFSDEDFMHDFFRKEYQKDAEPETYVNVSKYNPNWMFNAFARKQTNDFFSTTERLPDISMEWANRRIGNSPFYHDGIDSIAFLRQIDGDEMIPTYDALRFDTYHRVSYPKKYMGWLEVVPRVGARGTHYNDDPLDEAQTRYILDTDVDFFTKIFKLWDYENPELNIHGLRHVIEPDIHYYYTPNPNIEPYELFQFDSIDALDYKNVFRLGVRNKLQTKRYGGSWDLIDLNTYIDYYPKPEEYEANEIDQERSFGDLGTNLKLFPSRNLKFETEAKIDTYDNKITSWNTLLSFYESDLYGINFEYRYLPDESNLFATEGYLQFSHEYAAKAYLRYQEETGNLEEAEIALFKDLRTWVGVISYRHIEEENEEDDNQIWMTFYLKALPNSSLLGGN
jgi:LPS-assembly protein